MGKCADVAGRDFRGSGRDRLRLAAWHRGIGKATRKPGHGDSDEGDERARYERAESLALHWTGRASFLTERAAAASATNPAYGPGSPSSITGGVCMTWYSHTRHTSSAGQKGTAASGGHSGRGQGVP